MALKRVRSVLFWSHLSAGVFGGVVILIMSATGAVLALKPQILDRIDREVRFVTPAATARLSPAALVEAARTARPDAAPVSIAIDRDPAAAVPVAMTRGGTVYVNPYTGAVLGTASEKAERFFQSMTNWHRWLTLEGEWRATGRAFTGASNLAFLVLAISGLYIWWPRQWTPQHARPILWFKRSRTGRARDFNWHNVIGFWCAPAIIVMTFSGVVMSYPWANRLLYVALGSTPPAAPGERAPAPGRAGGPGGREGAVAGRGRGAEEGGRGGRAAGAEAQARREPGATADAAPAAFVPAALDTLWARAEQQLPTWRTITLRFPNRADAPVVFSMSDGASWNRFARSSLTLDASSGDVRQWQSYDAGSLGQKARGWLRFAHTGELGGLPGQIVAGLGCLGGVVLVYTGLALAFRRLVGWKLWARIRGERASIARPVLDA